MKNKRYRIVKVTDAGPHECIVQRSTDGQGWEYVCSIRCGNHRTVDDVAVDAALIIEGLKMVDSITRMHT